MRDVVTRVLVVGYGYWGAHHVRVLANMPNVHVAVVDTDPQRLEEARSRYPQMKCVNSIEQILDEQDCVVVATPPGQHAAVASYSLSAGKHTLVEKPFTITIGEAKALLALARESNSLLMVGHTFIYHQALSVLKNKIAEGELGDILYIDSARLALGKYRQDINAIWDLAPHDISILSYLLSGVPRAVTAWDHRSQRISQADLAYIRLEFENEVNAFINVSWISPQKTRRVTVVGSGKMAIYDYLSTTEPLRIYDNTIDFGASQLDLNASPGRVSYRTGGIDSPYIPFNEPLAAQDAHFIECVRTSTPPSTPGEHGLENVRVLVAIDESCRTGRRVKISQTENEFEDE